LPPGAHFCPSCGTPTSAPADRLPAGGDERKIVSVIFADLIGFTAASDGADPEDMRRRLGPYHEAIREEVERYGGRVEKLMGDGVLAVFGAPVVHEDDAERAVRAGLRIQERVSALARESGLGARVAVGTGEAVVAIEGTTMDREGLVGDVVNTTSRLQNEAPRGSVLVDEPTHRSTRRAFHYQERPPVVLRGKSEPVPVWVAVAPVGRLGADIDDSGVPLVGRGPELTIITSTFDRSVREGASHLVTIGGEPGVGKSRMVRELRRHVDDQPALTRWRQGRCLPYGEGITFWALGEIVKAEAGILETDPPGTAVGKLQLSLEELLPDLDERAWVAGRLAPLVGSDAEPVVERSERFAAWSRYVTSLAVQRPTVLVFEDLHWAEPAMLEFLAGLSEATRGTPLLLVCTARPDFFEDHAAWGAGHRNAVTVRLDPLNEAEIREMLDELLAGGDVDPERRAAIATRSGGNPLWAQEFARMLRDRPDAATDAALPDSVQAVVAARIDLLDPDAKTVLQAAATVGKSFWSGAVGAMLPGVGLELDDLLAALSRRELVRRERVSTMEHETEFAFTHSVVRDVAYSQVPRRVRSERHSRVARWITAKAGGRIGDRATVIAHHDGEALRLALADEVPDVTALVDAAIESHRLAARHVGRLDVEVQRRHLEAALELLPTDDRRRPDVLWELAECLIDAGVLRDVAAKLALEARRAFDDLGDVEKWGIVTARLGNIAWLEGSSDEAEAYFHEAVERLEQVPPGPALAEAYARWAAQEWLAGNSQEAISIVERTHPIVEAHGSLRARTRILSADGGARFDLGDPTAIDPFRKVLAMAVEGDDSFTISSSHLNLGEQLRTGWGPTEALAVHLRGLEVTRLRHIDGGRQFLLQSEAIDHLLLMRLDDAAAAYVEYDEITEKLPYLVPLFVLGKAQLAAMTGAPLSIDDVERSLAEAESYRDLQAVVPGNDTAAWIYELTGDHDRALACARTVVERSGATRFLLDAMPMTARILRRAGELDRIAALLPQLRRFEMPRPEALIAFVDALVSESTDPVAALADLESAAERLAAVDVRLEAIMALSEAMRVAAALGDEAATGRVSRAATALAAGAGSTVFLEKLGLSGP